MTLFDTSQLRTLETDLGKVPANALKAAVKAVTKSGDELKDTWRANARATSGDHGKLYPDTITAEPSLGLGTVGVEVGPDSGRPQGGMGPGFEFGSQNQPPHMDGNRAADAVEPKFTQAVADAVADAITKLL